MIKNVIFDVDASEQTEAIEAYRIPVRRKKTKVKLAKQTRKKHVFAGGQ